MVPLSTRIPAAPKVVSIPVTPQVTAALEVLTVCLLRLNLALISQQKLDPVPQVSSSKIEKLDVCGHCGKHDSTEATFLTCAQCKKVPKLRNTLFGCLLQVAYCNAHCQVLPFVTIILKNSVTVFFRNIIGLHIKTTARSILL